MKPDCTAVRAEPDGNFPHPNLGDSTACHVRRRNQPGPWSCLPASSLPGALCQALACLCRPQSRKDGHNRRPTRQAKRQRACYVTDLHPAVNVKQAVIHTALPSGQQGGCRGHSINAHRVLIKLTAGFKHTQDECTPASSCTPMWHPPCLHHPALHSSTRTQGLSSSPWFVRYKQFPH